MEHGVYVIRPAFKARKLFSAGKKGSHQGNCYKGFSAAAFWGGNHKTGKLLLHALSPPSKSKEKM